MNAPASTPRKADHGRHPAARARQCRAGSSARSPTQQHQPADHAPAPAASDSVLQRPLHARRRRAAVGHRGRPAGPAAAGGRVGRRRSRRSVGTSDATRGRRPAAPARGTPTASPAPRPARRPPPGRPATGIDPGRRDRAEDRRPQPLRVLRRRRSRTSHDEQADAEALQRPAEQEHRHRPAPARRRAARPGTRPTPASSGSRHADPVGQLAGDDHADHRGDQQRGEGPAVPGQAVQLARRRSAARSRPRSPRTRSG